MARRFYDLPTLTSLAAFEAAARHQNFNLASAELNVTPGALSRQIKSLEQELDAVLFNRSASGVLLTADGLELYGALSFSFNRVAQTVQGIRSGDPGKRVTLACSQAMASMWLIPRMGDFWLKYPEIQVDHLISDDARQYRRAEVDLRIRYGFGAWPDEAAAHFSDDEIYPVCGPKFAQVHGPGDAKDLPYKPLIHVDWVDPVWTDWSEFLLRADVPHGPLSGRRYSTFDMTMQAVQENQGVAIGWHHLVEPLIAEGKIERFTDVVLPAPGSYYLTWNVNRDLSPAAQTLKSWLLDPVSAS